MALRLRVAVDEVDRDGDRKLPTELFPTETLEEVGRYRVTLVIKYLVRLTLILVVWLSA